MKEFRYLEKSVMIFFLLLAIYLIITCPCDKFMNCKKYPFITLLSIPIIYVLYLQYIK